MNQETDSISVLLVDDDPADAELTRIALEDSRQQSFRVTVRMTLRDALEELRSHRFDVLLLDLGLPESVGLDTLEKVRQLDQITPIVVFTGLNDEESALRSLDHGAQDYLIKGDVSPNVLCRSIRYAIQRQQLLQELAESRRRAEETKFRQLLDSAPDAFVVVNSSGFITLTNRQAEIIFGYPKQQLLGRPIEMLIADRDRDAHRDCHNKLLADGVAQPVNKGGELAAVRSDGSEFPVEISLAPVQTDDGLWIATAIRDIGERKRTEGALREKEEQYRQAQKMESLGRLAGGIAHDFNNLLTIILGYSELLNDESVTPASRQEMVQVLQDTTRRGTSLTRQMLLFSRRIPVQPKVLSLNSAVENVEKMLKRLIDANIALKTALSSDPVWVRADAGQLEQIIVNLVLNACDAMPEGGTLTLTTSCASSEVTGEPCEYSVLSVTDTGCGMTEDVKSRLFEPFFTTKPVGKGTGLGLATVYGVVQEAGGYVSVDSQLNEGATFNVYLPRAAEPKTSQAGTGAAESAGTGSETILLVEDEQPVRKLAQLILESSGYRVLTAANGEEALEEALAYESEIHLLLTDVVMPRMSGDVLAVQMRKHRPAIRVLYMSGYSEGAVLEAIASDQNSQLLPKPFSKNGLLAAVREMLQSIQASDSPRATQTTHRLLAK